MYFCQKGLQINCFDICNLYQSKKTILAPCNSVVVTYTPGGGGCCGLDARTLRWGIPPSGGKGALLARLWLLPLHNVLVFTLLQFIFQNILAVILWKQFPVIRCAAHWRSIEYHVGSRNSKQIAYLWRLCVAYSALRSFDTQTRSAPS